MVGPEEQGNTPGLCPDCVCESVVFKVCVHVHVCAGARMFILPGTSTL